MIRLNMHEAKTHLSRYSARVEAGEHGMTLVTPDRLISHYPVRILW